MLEVTRHATPEEIKKAFKQRALLYHPDKNPTGEAMFKRINAAYAVLSNKMERRKYDSDLERRASRASSLSRRSTFGVFGGGGNKWRSPSPASRGGTSTAATREFVANLMKEEKEKAQRMKASSTSTPATSGGFASWYQSAQKDWASQQTAQEQLKAELRRKADSAAHESEMRKERLRGIEVELAQRKAEDLQQRAQEAHQNETKAGQQELKRAELQAEIDRQEQSLSQRLQRLGEKWTDTYLMSSSQLPTKPPRVPSSGTNALGSSTTSSRKSTPPLTTASTTTFSPPSVSVGRSYSAAAAATPSTAAAPAPEPIPLAHCSCPVDLATEDSAKGTAATPSQSRSQTESHSSISPQASPSHPTEEDTNSLSPRSSTSFSPPSTRAEPSSTPPRETAEEVPPAEDEKLDKALDEVRKQRAALREHRAQMRAEEAKLWQEVKQIRADRLVAEAASISAQGKGNGTGFRYASFSYLSPSGQQNPQPDSAATTSAPNHRSEPCLKAREGSGRGSPLDSSPPLESIPSAREMLTELRRQLAEVEDQAP